MRILTKPLLAVACLCISLHGISQTWNVSAAPGGIPIHTNVSGAQEQTVLCATTVRDGIIYAWRDNRTGTNGQDIWCQKYTPCGTIAPGWPAAGLSICNSSGTQQLPQIIPDGSDGAIIVWQDNRSGNYDIYAQHVTGAGVPTWGNALTGLVICSQTGTQQNPHLCTDGAGGAIIVWDDQRSGNWDVWAQRVNAAGVVQWNPAAGGNPVVVQTNTQDQNAIYTDGVGGAYIAWEDNRPSAISIDIMGTRIDGNGVLYTAWAPAPNGAVVLSNQSGSQITPCIVSYPNQDVMFAWCDPFGAGQSIRASKYNSAAVLQPGWVANGNLVGFAITSSGNPGTASQPRIVADCSGGAIISYRSPYGGGDNDVITRAMNANGTQGAQELTAFSTNWEGNHEIASDGNGGAFNTFENRNAPTVVQYRKFLSPTVTASGGNNTRNIPNICSMGGVAYLVWEDARTGTLGAHDLYAGATSALAPPPILNSTLTQTYTAASCNITTQNVTACTGTSITFTVPLPAGLFSTYTFYDGATVLQTGSSNTFTTSALSVGTHTITATSQTAAGCVTANSNQIVITVGAGPAATASQTNITCPGGNNGTATANATTGGPFTYLWSPSGGTAATATGLSQGTYTCVVTGSNGCTTSVTASVTAPAAFASTTGTTPATCGNNNGTASVSVSGGTPGYTYLWSPSGGTSPIATGLTAGVYTCTVTDANGCTAQFSATVNNSGAPSVTLSTQTNVSCNGGSNGSATVSASGGSSPYTYAWSPSGGTSATATGLTAGTYTCLVTDALGCAQSATVTITQPALLTSVSSGTDPLCNSGATGTATVTPSGGTGPYTYNWSPTGGTAATATALAAGNYTCTVTDANGCTSTSSVVLTAPSAYTITATQNNVSCNGGSNGVAAVTVTGATPGYTYAWLPSGGTGSSATNLTAGGYTCTVTDANGCTSTQTFSITQPAILNTSSVQTNVSCNGDSTGTSTVTATGGTPTYSYLWLPYGGTAATGTGLAAGTYTCTVSDANGCQANHTVTITQNTAVTSTVNSTDALCNGAASGSATVNASGGTPGYTYLWSNSTTTATANGLSAGTYSVTVTDVNGCTHVQTAVISEPAAITATSASSDATCGATNGSGTVIASGGTPGYTYLWSSGGTGATENSIGAGVYTCTITDLNGCTHVETVTVNNIGAPSVTMNTPTDVTCNGGNDGSANVSVSGGTAPYTYSWTPSGGTAATATGLSAGNYICTVTDQIGCISSVSVVISEPAPLTAGTMITDETCGNINGSATLTVSGGNGSYTYLWSSGGTAATENNLSAGNYTCIVTDVSGCSATFSVTINNNAGPSVTAGSQNDVSCFMGLNGSITVNVTGGSPGYSYSWAPTGGTSQTASGLAAGTYTCVVTDVNGCTQTFSTIITEPNPLQVSNSTVDPTCLQPAGGSITVTVSGGTGPYIYSWLPSGGSGSTATGLTANSYTCQIIDANGCSISDSATLNIAGGPVVTIQSQSDPLCSGGNNGSATVTNPVGNGPFTYLWSPGGATTAAASGLSAQSYTCTVTDVNGCTSTVVVVLNDPPQITSNPAATGASCNGASDGTVSVAASGGTGTLTYLWNPGGATTATVNNVSAGTYTCTITDANGCTFTQTATVTQPAAISSSVTSVPGCGNNSGGATVSASGGAGNYTYAWSPSGGNNATASGLSNGSYTVLVTDGNGCTNTGSVSVSNYTLPVVTASGGGTIYPGGSTTLNSSGGVSYVWSPSSGLSCTNCASPVAEPSASTVYCVTGTDANGCTDTACVAVNVSGDCGEVFVPNAFSPNNDGSNDVLCVYGKQCIAEMELMIYSRWGELVFESRDPDACWDGTYKGESLNTGVFVFYLRGTMLNGDPLMLEGNISLMR